MLYIYIYIYIYMCVYISDRPEVNLCTFLSRGRFSTRSRALPSAKGRSNPKRGSSSELWRRATPTLSKRSNEWYALYRT